MRRMPTPLMDNAAVLALEHHESTGEPPRVLYVNRDGRPINRRTLDGMIERGLVKAIDHGSDHLGRPVRTHELTPQGVRRAQHARMNRLHTLTGPPTPAQEAPLQGRVIAHQGHGRGLAPEHAHDPTARQAACDLAEAGLPLADIPETYDPQTSTATGYMVVPRGEDEGGGAWVYVYYLSQGRMDDPRTGRRPRAELKQAMRALRNAGWGVDPLPIKCVRAVTETVR